MRTSKPRRRPGEDEVLELESDWLNKNLDEDLAVLRSSSHSLPLAPKLALLEKSISGATVIGDQPRAIAESTTTATVSTDAPGESGDPVVVDTPISAAVVPTTTAVVSSPDVPNQINDLWRSEPLGLLFPGRRVRRLTHAEAALTAPEKAVYDLLWEKSYPAPSTAFRLARVGYDRIARATGVTKRNAALILDRLIEKGFIEVSAEGDATTAREYRVFDLANAFERLQALGRNWIVRSGNGVLFVYRVSASIQRAEQ